MNRLFWSLIIFEAVIAFGLAIVLILFPGKGGPNILDSLVGRAEAGLSNAPGRRVVGLLEHAVSGSSSFFDNSGGRAAGGGRGIGRDLSPRAGE